MKLDIYLNYPGNCRQAFRFYEQHLGGKMIALSRFTDAPTTTGVPANWKDKVMYARMTLGETEVSGNDVPPDRFEPMRSVYLSLTVDSTPEAERIYALLSDGGQVFMPMQETFFAFRFAMLRDKFGTSWMIIHDRPMPA